MRSKIGVGAIVLIIAATVGYALLSSPEAQQTPQPETAPSNSTTTSSPQTTPEGRYTDYSETARSDPAFTTTILFFHANWCPECRAYEQAILTSEIPQGVQILKVDYDNSQELKERYGVTIQTTFVRVNTEGEPLAKWVGYNQTKSVDAILNNTGT